MAWCAIAWHAPTTHKGGRTRGVCVVIVYIARNVLFHSREKWIFILPFFILIFRCFFVHPYNNLAIRRRRYYTHRRWYIKINNKYNWKMYVVHSFKLLNSRKSGTFPSVVFLSPIHFYYRALNTLINSDGAMENCKTTFNNIYVKS